MTKAEEWLLLRCGEYAKAWDKLEAWAQELDSSSVGRFIAAELRHRMKVDLPKMAENIGP